MMVDTTTEFADNVSLPTGSTADVRTLLGNVVDFEITGYNPANAGSLSVVLIFDTSVTFTSTPTVTFEIVSDATAAIATDGTATAHYVTGVLAAADMANGKRVVMPLPPSNTYERYLGVIVHIVGAAGKTVDAGKISAFVALNAGATWISYPDAVN